MILTKIRPFFAPGKEAVDVAIPWLLVLRWGEILCQLLLMMVVVLLLDTRIPVFLVAFILVFQGGTNLYLHFRQSRNIPISNFIIVIILLLDTVFLTVLLHFTGGAMNPFVFLYFLHIVLGAIILQAICSWLVTFATILCYGLLFYFPSPVINDFSGPSKLTEFTEGYLNGGTTISFQLHHQGTWVAFFITAFFVVFFVSKIQKSLAEHRITLITLEQEKAQNEKLSSLATLAAGAAHELSTPLSTVAVISNEMIHALKAQDCNSELLEDTYVIRKQIADCKEILYQMAAGAGKHLGEEVKRYSIQEVIAQILQEIDEEHRQRIKINIETKNGTVRIPFRSMCRTIKGLLHNGLEASNSKSDVAIHSFISSEKLYIKIVDYGTGIEERNKELVTTPFFTTKESGLGLGLFLAKTLVDQFRGTLEILSESDCGTIVIMGFSLDLLDYKP